MKEDTLNRLKELESKFLFQEDSMERMSKEMRVQQIEIIKLKDQVQQLESEQGESGISENKTEEKPPHY
jgi:uncharacterized coiled-coil protein SlyX|tara:strand:- start:2650 stop:2856 length:207 start_codon:yes stop_codon:yes gene_type:complete